jgi:virulence factor Mce-like protein
MRVLRRLLTLPGRALRGTWRFADPKLKAGRIPYGRTVLVLQLIGALIFVGYTLGKKQILLPFSPEPYYVEVELVDAAGLDPSNEPAASVAGASVGRVTEVVYEGGKAVATLRLDPDVEGRIFADASASLRPINVLQVLNVNVHPGDPATGPLPENQRIEADRTDAFVSIDELTATFDADTQAQVQVLISEAATALGGREPELRRILERIGEMTGTARPVARALDRRRALLSRLVGHLDVVFGTLGQRRTQLARAIEAGSRTFAVTADREAELSAATRELAPTVAEAQRSLAAARRLADPLSSALGELLPVAGNLEPAGSKALGLIDRADGFLDDAEALVAAGRRPVRLFEQGTRGLAQRVRRDLIPAIDDFGVTISALDKYKGGIAQTADLWSSAFSVSANGGAYSQIYAGNQEMTPQGLGLGPAAARSRGGRPSRLALMLAEALERTCRDVNSLACTLRFSNPELPPEPVLPRSRDGEGEG